MSTIGKDEKGRIWFKSDWYLSDITEAIDFKVSDDSFLFWSCYRLVAVVPYNINVHGEVRKMNDYGRYIPYVPQYFQQTIGWYKNIQTASNALEALMVLKGIKEMNFLDGKFT